MPLFPAGRSRGMLLFLPLSWKGFHTTRSSAKQLESAGALRYGPFEEPLFPWKRGGKGGPPFNRSCSHDSCGIETTSFGEKRAMNHEKKVYVRVKDGAGNLFLCPIEALKDPKDATEEELENCVDDGVVGRYAGEIKTVER